MIYLFTSSSMILGYYDPQKKQLLSFSIFHYLLGQQDLVSLDADFFMSFCRCPLDVPGLVLKLCENLNAEDACRTKKKSINRKNIFIRM